MPTAKERARHLTDKREQAYMQMCDTFRPYLGRIVAEWENKAKDSLYIWLVCSRTEDADEGRHQWRGTVAVRIMPDGAAFVFPGEDFAARAAGLTVPGTWTGTAALLDTLIPDLPPLAAAAPESGTS
jgi:hypothetical protein